MKQEKQNQDEMAPGMSSSDSDESLDSDSDTLMLETFGEIASTMNRNETWHTQISHLETPAEFLRYFGQIGIPGEKWKSSGWLQIIAKLSPIEGGIHRNLSGLYAAIKKRFCGQPDFVAWMEGKEKPKESESWSKVINTFASPQDFLTLFKQIGIPDDKWKSSSWLMKKADLPPAEGGINKNLSGLPYAIRKRFGGHRAFVAWMEGKEKPKESEPWSKVINTFASPQDFLTLFEQIGIPDDKWKNSTWLTTKAKLPTHKGGIDKSLSGLCATIWKRFGGHPDFVAWMEGKEKNKKTESWPERINACATPQDFLTWFGQIGIPGDKWKNSTWLTTKAKLSPKKGGINENLNGMTKAIWKRFGSHRAFIAWMEDKEKTGSWPERINACATPQDFLTLFGQIGIPDDKWKNSGWIGIKANLSPAEGGINKNLSGLPHSIRKRFGGYPNFVAWMEDKEKTGTWAERINALATPQDFLTLFGQIGIPGNKWESTDWLNKKARLSTDEGGINKNLSGLCAAIWKRFGGHPDFVAWMEGTPVATVTSPTSPEEATDLIKSEASRLGVFPEDLLDPEKISEYVKKSPMLKEILNYFASK